MRVACVVLRVGFVAVCGLRGAVRELRGYRCGLWVAGHASAAASATSILAVFVYQAYQCRPCPPMWIPIPRP
jgi:hypothetical protein